MWRTPRPRPTACPLLWRTGPEYSWRAYPQKCTPLVEEFIVAPYKTNLGPDELITGFALEPMKSGYRWSFQRIARRGALAIARANAAALGKVASDGVVEDLRLSVGSTTPQPARMTAAEELLRGSVPNPELIADAARKVSQEMVRLSGIRPTTQYKRPAVEGLVRKVLAETLLEGVSSIESGEH